MVRARDWALVAEQTRHQANVVLATGRLAGRAQCFDRLQPADPTTRCDLTDGHAGQHRHTWGHGPGQHLDWA